MKTQQGNRNIIFLFTIPMLLDINLNNQQHVADVIPVVVSPQDRVYRSISGHHPDVCAVSNVEIAICGHRQPCNQINNKLLKQR